jgi:hypothetical protein
MATTANPRLGGRPPNDSQQDDADNSAKARGNRAYVEGDYGTAIAIYSTPIDATRGAGSDDRGACELHLLLSNRAAARLALYARRNRELESAPPVPGAPVDAPDALLRGAVADAQRCTALAPSFRRGWTRLAKARRTAGDHLLAIAAAVEAARLDAAAAAAGELQTLDEPRVATDVVEVVAEALVAEFVAIRAAARGSAARIAAPREVGLPSPLRCPQCCATIHQPVTLADGQSVCRLCVPRYRKANRGLAGLPAGGQVGRTHAGCDGFGQSTTVVLQVSRGP